MLSNTEPNTEQVSAFNPHNSSTEDREPVQVMVVGSQPGINNIIKSLHALGFAEAGDWSKPQRYPNSDRSMSIMTKWRQP